MAEEPGGTPAAMMAQAREALLSDRFDVDPHNPLAAAILRARRRIASRGGIGALLTRWSASHLGGKLVGDTRYRWPVRHRRVPLPPYVEQDPRAWRPWRQIDSAGPPVDPFDLEAELILPIVLSQCGELLHESLDDPEHGQAAFEILDEADPVLRRDFAQYVQALQPWRDTFGLWCLTRTPHLLGELHPIGVAISNCFAARASRQDGYVLGRGYPFHEKPLVSAGAQLARSLLALGMDLPILAHLASWIATQQRASGGFGDPGAPEDVLTTLVAADLLLAIEPDYDPTQTLAFLATRRTSHGTWRAFATEEPWLTAELLDWSERASRPFATRFAWPCVQRHDRDPKTDLPTYARFAALRQLLDALPGLARAPIQIAFVDLAGFKAFNDEHGQDAGDDALALFARCARETTGLEVIRDGGDEFLLLDVPGGGGVASALERLQGTWPGLFREQYGAATVVAPRIVWARTVGSRVTQAREALGRALAPLKDRTKRPDPRGVCLDIGDV